MIQLVVELFGLLQRARVTDCDHNTMADRLFTLSTNAPSLHSRELQHHDSGIFSPAPPSRKYRGFDEDLWHKVLRAADGIETLSADDAKRIISILRAEEDDNKESHIVSLIMSRLKASKDIMDEGFLRYLSENYNKLVSDPDGHVNASFMSQSEDEEHPNVDECPDGSTDVSYFSTYI
jgi:hypothetical protein